MSTRIAHFEKKCPRDVIFLKMSLSPFLGVFLRGKPFNQDQPTPKNAIITVYNKNIRINTWQPLTLVKLKFMHVKLMTR